MGANKLKHIGIIACSYEGAALCYKTICKEAAAHLGEYVHPEISLHTHPLNEYIHCINTDSWNGVAELMRSSANKLILAGAEILICPDNTIHKVYAVASKDIDVPWLHIAEEVAAEASRNNYIKTGILGTQYLMESNIYPDFFNTHQIITVIPGSKQRTMINQIIFKELVNGIITIESRNFLLAVIDELKSQGCDSVVLGCTEIPLIISPGQSAIPTLDSTRILARAALLKAIE